MESQLNAVGQAVGGPALGALGSTVSVRAALLAAAAVLSSTIGLYAAARDDDRQDGCYRRQLVDCAVHGLLALARAQADGRCRPETDCRAASVDSARFSHSVAP